MAARPRPTTASGSGLTTTSLVRAAPCEGPSSVAARLTDRLSPGAARLEGPAPLLPVAPPRLALGLDPLPPAPCGLCFPAFLVMMRLRMYTGSLVCTRHGGLG